MALAWAIIPRKIHVLCCGLIVPRKCPFVVSMAFTAYWEPHANARFSQLQHGICGGCCSTQMHIGFCCGQFAQQHFARFFFLGPFSTANCYLHGRFYPLLGNLSHAKSINPCSDCFSKLEIQDKLKDACR